MHLQRVKKELDGLLERSKQSLSADVHYPKFQGLVLGERASCTEGNTFELLIFWPDLIQGMLSRRFQFSTHPWTAWTLKRWNSCFGGQAHATHPHFSEPGLNCRKALLHNGIRVKILGQHRLVASDDLPNYRAEIYRGDYQASLLVEVQHFSAHELHDVAADVPKSSLQGGCIACRSRSRWRLWLVVARLVRVDARHVRLSS